MHGEMKWDAHVMLRRDGNKSNGTVGTDLFCLLVLQLRCVRILARVRCGITVWHKVRVV